MFARLSGVTVFFKFYIILSFLSLKVVCQAPTDEPCSAPSLKVNSQSSPCGVLTTYIINNSADSKSYFTNTTSASSGVTLPSLTSCGFSSTVKDFWYTITVPSTGYLTLELQGTKNNSYFDWVVYQSSSASCNGSSFSVIDGSVQCVPNNTASSLTTIGPAKPGSTIYLRMWLEANIGQASKATYILCANEISAPAPLPLCVKKVFPQNNAVLDTTVVNLAWQSSANAQDYIIYFKEINDQAFSTLANTSNVYFATNNLKPGHKYVWYVLPINADNVPNLSCVVKDTFEISSAGGNYTCETPKKICVPATVTLSDNVLNDVNTDIDYGCINSIQNQHFYWFKTSSSGKMHLNVTSTSNDEVNYACWGPFTGVTPLPEDCSSSVVTNIGGFACGRGLGAPVSCYNGSQSESDILRDVNEGEYYLLEINNVSFKSNNVVEIGVGVENTAAYDCACSINQIKATARPESCTNDIYAVDYEINLNAPPASGTLTIRTVDGISKIISAPFQKNIKGTLNGLNASVIKNYLTAQFSNVNCVGCGRINVPPFSPVINQCTVPENIFSDSIMSGYFNTCTGVASSELSYCGVRACKSVFYKFKTNGSGSNINLKYTGGNIGKTGCVSDLNVSVLSDCDNILPVGNSCQTFTASTTDLYFSGLQPNTQYYLCVSTPSCDNNYCSWSFRVTGTGIVPIKFGAFVVMRKNHLNKIYWNTLLESGIQKIELLRSIGNDKNFVAIKSFFPKNNITGTEYNYDDNIDIEGTDIYYRLKSTNTAGAVQYSEIRKVSITKKEVRDILISPNPFTNASQLIVFSKKKGTASYYITDNIGRKLVSKSIKIFEGENKIILSEKALPNGKYYLTFNNDSEHIVTTVPFVKY